MSDCPHVEVVVCDHCQCRWCAACDARVPRTISQLARPTSYCCRWCALTPLEMLGASVVYRDERGRDLHAVVVRPDDRSFVNLVVFADGQSEADPVLARVRGCPRRDDPAPRTWRWRDK